MRAQVTAKLAFYRRHRASTKAWWLAYDTLNAVDRELRDVDLLLQGRGREVLKARRVKGAGSPEILARSVQTRGWRPVDARLQVSDVPRIVEHLGGAKLYGNDPTVALRELIQNAADAVQARRKYQKRSADWGLIAVGLFSEGDRTWLVVEDNGIGMSEQVLTGPLLDFGTSFWRSPLAMEEFPGLMAAGMHAIGRFGIGFFSVFMLGPVVRVYTRHVIRQVWGEDLQEDEEERVIGKVSHTDITRRVTVFRTSDENDGTIETGGAGNP
jgi:histidine kinase/DNA gyrase B/HSP90-like ATPase